MGNEEDLPESRSECGNVTTIQRPVDPGYVIRTNSLKGRVKVFINVCQSEAIAELSKFTNQDRTQDVLWNVPYGLGGARDEHGKRGDRFKVFDFIIHPNTFRMTETNPALKKVIDELAVEIIMKQFSVRLDKKGLTFPELTYKGAASSVGYVENVATVAIDGEVNGLKVLFGSHCGGLQIGRNGSNCQANFPCAKENECAKDEKHQLDDDPGKHIHDECNGTVMSMAGGDIAVKEIDNSLVFADDPVSDMMPDYKSQQDETTLTYIFGVEKVKNENVSFSVLSPQEICLKMMTVGEKGSPLRYTCYLKFSSKCRLMENGCHVDVSDVNVVLTLAKAEKSSKKWNTYFVGTSPKHLEVRDFVTVDNLKGLLDSLDLNGNLAENDQQKTAENVNVASVTDEKLVLEIKKAEEKEMDDVPGEIIVIHEKGLPRLHGILKQRSVSESSDDLSMWSNSTDRHMSTATGSEVESDEEEYSQGAFIPQFKKSVSFNEHIDQTMYVTNQSVTQMHALLKNKRRRIRKREQKHDVKEARRRYRSNSDSCSHDEREFDCRPLEERILATMIKMKSAADKSEDDACASASSTGVECNGRIEVVSGNSVAVETNQDEGKVDEENLISGDVEVTCGNNLDRTSTVDEGKLISGDVEATCGSNLHNTGTADEEKFISGDVEGTSGSNLGLIRDITSLETCGGTTTGEGCLSGNDLITDADDGDFRDIKCPTASESYLYTPVERTSGCGDFVGLKSPLTRDEPSTSVRTFNSSDGSILEKKSSDDVVINADLFSCQFASSFSVSRQREKVKYRVLENGKNSDSDDSSGEGEEENGAGTLSMSL